MLLNARKMVEHRDFHQSNYKPNFFSKSRENNLRFANPDKYISSNLLKRKNRNKNTNI